MNPGLTLWATFQAVLTVIGDMGIRPNRPLLVDQLFVKDARGLACPAAPMPNAVAAP